MGHENAHSLECRKMVKQFNAALKMKVTERGYHWMDFFDELLTPEGDQLREEFALDGTHLHPSYLSLVAKAL
jgi:lysophospholipase L1-like esterase